MRDTRLQKIFLVAAILILIGLVYFLFFRTKPLSPPTNAAPSIIHVTPIHTDVSVKEGGEDFRVIPEAKDVTSGSAVKTSATGRALLESSSSHITRLDYSSEITIVEEQKKTQIHLVSGAVWSRIQKVFDSGESYEVQTPNAIATVRGTSFGVWYQDDTTILIVIDGSVLITPVSRSEDRGILVKAGYRATRVGSGNIVVEPLTKQDLTNGWVLYNTGATAPVSTQTSGTAGAPMSPATPPATTTSTGLSTSPPPPEQDLVRLSGIAPTRVTEGKGELVTASGQNLDQVVVLTIDGASVNFRIMNTTSLSFNAPINLSVGKHTVSVEGPNGRVVSLSGALTVDAAPVTSPTITSPNSTKP